MTPFCLSFFPFLQATVMFWMLNWILACPILVWTEANVFSSDLGDTNANALEQITMETAVKKVKFEVWDRNLSCIWMFGTISTFFYCRMSAKIRCQRFWSVRRTTRLSTWLFDYLKTFEMQKLETLYYYGKKVVFFVVKNHVKYYSVLIRQIHVLWRSPQFCLTYYDFF